MAIDAADAMSGIRGMAEGAASDFFNVVAGIKGNLTIYGAISNLARDTKSGEDPELKVAQSIFSLFLGGAMKSLGSVFDAAAGSIAGPMAGSSASMASTPMFGMPTSMSDMAAFGFDTDDIVIASNPVSAPAARPIARLGMPGGFTS